MPDFHAVAASPVAFASAVAWVSGLSTVRYVVFVGLSFLAWAWWLRRPARFRKIQQPMPQSRQIWREIGHSALSLLIFGVVVPVAIVLGADANFAFYKDIATYGWGYFFLSIAIMMLIQDTYFYWMHRLMHRRALFRHFHRTHHLSTNPTPWSTYAVSPLEAVVDSVPTVLILFFIPKTLVAFVIFLWLNTAYAVYGHLGYEIFPRTLATHWLGRWINTSVAHNTHHAKGRYNYGWYFLFWDRLMGTLDPEYDRRYLEATVGKQIAQTESRQAA